MAATAALEEQRLLAATALQEQDRLLQQKQRLEEEVKQQQLKHTSTSVLLNETQAQLSRMTVETQHLQDSCAEYVQKLKEQNEHADLQVTACNTCHATHLAHNDMLHYHTGEPEGCSGVHTPERGGRIEKGSG